MVLNDVFLNKYNQDEANPFSTSALLGDLLVLGGAFLYATSNILQEYFLESGADVFNYLSHLGLFGCLITLAESFILGEYVELEFVSSNDIGKITGFYAGFCLVNLIIYTIVPFFVRRSGATLLNISNLTTILWSMLIDIFMFKNKFVSCLS